jgi:hypothetical protein
MQIKLEEGHVVVVLSKVILKTGFEASNTFSYTCERVTKKHLQSPSFINTYAVTRQEYDRMAAHLGCSYCIFSNELKK